jgi:basic amino acid/polyamine antiporter, APA family
MVAKLTLQSIDDPAPLVREKERDAGLVRAVGTLGLTASIVNIVVGAGIFAVPGALAAAVGSYAPLAFLICAVAIGMVAICFAEGGSRVPTSGGAYGYIEAAFGPLTGSVAGTLLWFGNVLACASIAAALAAVAVSVLPPGLRAVASPAIVIVVVGAIALVNVAGVSSSAKLINAATAIKLIPLAVFVLAGIGAVHRANFTSSLHPSPAGFGRAIILALFAFTGMETPLSASGEVIQPARTIPRAILIAMSSLTLVYVAIQVVAQGILGDSLASSTVPLADGMARISPALRVLMLGGAAFSMFGWIGSDLLGSPRILFAFARDGMLPGVLGRVQPQRHTPHVAIFCYAALAIGLALTGTFAELAVLATLATAALYASACGAAWTLARRGVSLAGEPLNFRWLGVAATGGIASMIVLVALASRTEILGLFVVIAVSAAIYWVVLRVPRASVLRPAPDVNESGD